jgi:hypothetical protein
VGANGTVLTANSAQADGVEWATPAAPATALNLITTATAAGTALTTSINNCFTSTYENYLVVINMVGANEANFTFKFRASSTDTSTNYCQAGQLIDSNSDTVSVVRVDNGTAASLRDINTTGGFWVLEIGRPNVAARTPYSIRGIEVQGANNVISSFFANGAQTGTTQFDGISVISSSGNQTGTVRVYGYANS